MTLMQTLLFGHVPVLSQMTEVHAGLLMMKRSVCVMYVCHNATTVSEKSMQLCNCAKADNICVVESSKSSSVMLPLHMHNFENIFVAEEMICLQNHANCLHVQTKLCAHILSMHTDTDSQA